MAGSILNEHDAHLGAQSRGEFLGMSGNSSWWLLSSAGIAVLMVIFLWGVLEVPLLPCLAAGLGLCLLSLLYVFALKNDRPTHYDTDFFESVLVESGALELSFGPRLRHPENPFVTGTAHLADPAVAPVRFGAGRSARSGPATVSTSTTAPTADPEAGPAEARAEGRARRKPAEAAVVPAAAYERLEQELSSTQDLLEDALMAGGEEEV